MTLEEAKKKFPRGSWCKDTKSTLLQVEGHAEYSIPASPLQAMIMANDPKTGIQVFWDPKYLKPCSKPKIVPQHLFTLGTVPVYMNGAYLMIGNAKLTKSQMNKLREVLRWTN